MAQRKSIAGRRSCVLYMVILAALALIVAGIGLVLVVRPELDRRRQAEIRLEQAETHYQAGVAFQDVGDWEAAEVEFKQVLTLDPDYKDVQMRLAEVKAKQQEALVQAQAKAVQATATMQARAEATATAATVEARTAQATSVAATATAQARATVQAQEAKATATAEVLTQLEAHYQKGLGYINLSRWEQAKAEFEQVFAGDPNYKDVQAKLAEVEAGLGELRTLTPAVTSTPVETPVPAPTATNTPSPLPVNVVTNGDFEVPNLNSILTYKAAQSFGAWTVEYGSVDHIPGSRWQAASGNQSVDLSGVGAGTISQDLPTIPGQASDYH